MFLRQPWCPSSNSHLPPPNAHLLPRPGEVHHQARDGASSKQSSWGAYRREITCHISLCSSGDLTAQEKSSNLSFTGDAPFYCLQQGQPTFSVKSQMVNILGFAGHTEVSATTSSYIREWVWLCSDKTLLIKTCSGPDLAHKSSFANPWPMRLRSGKVQKLSCRSPGTKQGGLPFRFSNRVSWALPTFYSPREANGASMARPVTMASQSQLLARLAVPHSLQVLWSTLLLMKNPEPPEGMPSSLMCGL